MNTSTESEATPAALPCPSPSVALPEAPLSSLEDQPGDIHLSSILGKSETLSEAEEAEFQECEAAIQRGGLSFVEVGLSLARIRKGRLYKGRFDTFEQYYRVRWGFQHAKVYYLMASAQVYRFLANLPDVPKPDHESQLRPLLPLTPDQAQLAWNYAAARSAGRPMTAKLVKSAVSELHLVPVAEAVAVQPLAGLNKTQKRQLVMDAMDELLILVHQQTGHDILAEKLEALHRRLRAVL
jgi:hypothetical protein